MSKFTIGIVGRQTNLHTSCFDEVAKSIAYALRELGHEVTDFDNPGRIIAFGANNISDPDGNLPKNAIIFNTEQVAATGVASQMTNFRSYRKHVVWDYSQSNIKMLASSGVKAIHCPIGYTPLMKRIEPAAEQDIDVLFYGASNKRRQTVLHNMLYHNVKVNWLFGVYGPMLDEMISRSKIVLNVHFYTPPVFEIFRCSYLWANSKCVVSEGGGQDAELEALASRAGVLIEWEKMAEKCRYLLDNPEERKAIEKRGFEEFSKIDFVESIRKALEETAKMDEELGTKP
jgi:hypothetical protein